MKRLLSIACGLSLITFGGALQAQDAQITLQANVGGICKLLSVKSSSGPLNRTGDFSNTIMTFSSAEAFVQAASATVTYSSVENTQCTYTLKTQNGGMKLGGSFRHYSAHIAPNLGVSSNLITNELPNASVSITTGPNPQPQDLRVVINFAAAPPEFIPNQGTYTDVLTLSVTGGV